MNLWALKRNALHYQVACGKAVLSVISDVAESILSEIISGMAHVRKRHMLKPFIRFYCDAKLYAQQQFLMPLHKLQSCGLKSVFSMVVRARRVL